MADKKITDRVLQTFDWDEQKNELNRAKHGIDFGDASEIFMDQSFVVDRTATMRSAGSR